MKTIVDRKEFLRALKVLAMHTRRSTIRTDVILIKEMGGMMQLAATTMEQSAIVNLPAKIEDLRPIYLEIKPLQKIVKPLKCETLQLENDKGGEKVRITGGNVTFELETVDPDQNPTPVMAVQERNCTLPAPNFLGLAGKVLTSASSDNSRPVLQGVNVNGRIAATDGFRIAVVPGGIEGFHGLIPATSLRKARSAFGHRDLLAWSEGNRIALSDGKMTLESLLIEGAFPDFDAIVPKRHRLQVSFVTRELTEGLQAISAACDNSHIFRMQVESDGKVILSSHHNLFANATVELQTEVEAVGEFSFPFLIAFNAQYLLDHICQAGERVLLRLNANNTPVSIVPADEENQFRGVIMPMHLG